MPLYTDTATFCTTSRPARPGNRLSFRASSSSLHAWRGRSVWHLLLPLPFSQHVTVSLSIRRQPTLFWSFIFSHLFTGSLIHARLPLIGHLHMWREQALPPGAVSLPPEHVLHSSTGSAISVGRFIADAFSAIHLSHIHCAHMLHHPRSPWQLL